MSSKKPAQNKGRFQATCPRRLKNLPSSPCPMALLRLEIIRSGKREMSDMPGCAWSCTSAEDNFCFWSMANRKGFDSMNTKEISEALSLSPAQVDKSEKSALEKLNESGNMEILHLISEQVHDLSVNRVDNSIFISESSSVDEMEGLAKESGAISSGTDSDDLDVPKTKQKKGKKKK